MANKKKQPPQAPTKAVTSLLGRAFFKSASACRFETWLGCAAAKNVVSCFWRYQQTAGGWPPTGGSFCPLIHGKGGCPMVTYSDLIQTGILVVGIIGLFMMANKKK